MPDVWFYCLDVAQGSCAVLMDEIPGRPGELQASVVDVAVAGKQLGLWLKQYGVTRIPAIILTHNDSDHIRGLGGLVESFRGKIDTLWMLTDRDVHPDSLCMPVQEWRDSGAIRRLKRLEAPSERPPGRGERVIAPPEASYSIYCIYPEMPDVESVVRGAPRTDGPLGSTANSVSAVLRIAISAPALPLPSVTQVLIGGDLDYLGWHHLVKINHDLNASVFVVPHHGGPAEASADFGPQELAAAVRPQISLISVGTEKNSGPRGYGHPHFELVQALRNAGSQVLCTQITPQCVAKPGTIPGGAVMARESSAPNIFASGVGCAGDIVVTLKENSPPEVRRFQDHSAAVNQLTFAGNAVLCR